MLFHGTSVKRVEGIFKQGLKNFKNEDLDSIKLQTKKQMLKNVMNLTDLIMTLNLQHLFKKHLYDESPQANEAEKLQ